ncbi:hypothetical protein HS961_08380 [Comamonas piscis]|uniref:Ig-like domain-containing protein n=1 Tax=Comamonas piscis TaxID=1562974 RepID=A0A7G5EFS8_9BURK|nr:hypothetical protein [Comamonas piscis]QMV72853.1 hypothetical protein HS961_08380 [Comamonas piscis]WSO35630.1 hypothetical protein VUJ63_08405 [Comamonas piscis]
MNPIGAQRTLRRLLYGGLASLALVCSFNASAASAGSGRAYGLQVTADVAGLGLGVPIADTGLKTAPPDFNTPSSVLNASVAAGAGNLLTVRTGVLTSSTQSKLAQNSVASSSSVSGLALKLAGLGLGADTISSQAKMSCVNGTLTPEGSAQILGASGSLVGVSVAANTRVDLTIGVPTLGTMVGVILHTNEQTLSPDGKTFSVNALRVELVASALGIRLLGASVIVGNSSATMADCAPTVTLGPLPLITTSNQAAIPVSGSCSAGSGNVTISSTPTGATQSLPCSATGSYSGSVNTTGLADGPVTLTASQPPAGPARSASQSTTKNTAPVLQPPVVTVVSAPHITAANQASYSVSGTCSANGASVAITIGSVGGATSTAQCSGGLWSATGLNVASLVNGPITVTASQTVSNLTGTGSLLTSKDSTGAVPVVVVTSAPAITAANQTSYTVSGTCSVNGTNVSVAIDVVEATVPCTGNIWAAAGLDVSGLLNGALTVTATQTANGQTGTGSLGTTKDSAGAIPVVTISLAPAITLANQAAYTVSGSCSVNGNNVAVLVGSVSASALCTNGGWSTAGLDVSALPNGSVTVMASQTVGAQTGSATLVTSKDVTGAVPVVAVTSAPTITPANQASYTVSGNCSVNGNDVAVLVGSVSATATCNGGIWSSTGVNVSSLLDGSVTVTASQTANGQTGSGSLVTSKNTVVDAPVVTISSAPAITAQNEAAYTVSGTCSADGTNVAVQVGSVTASAPCTGNIWSSPGLDVSGLTDGAVLVTASQTVGGQTGSGSLVTAKDTAGIAPVVAISAAPAITATNQSAYTVSGTCSVNGTNMVVLIGSIAASAACDAGLWTTSAVNVGALPDGAVTVTASQTANGQTGSGTLVIAKDTAGVAPAVAVTSAPAITGANQASYVVSGTCSANGTNVAVLVGSIAASAMCDGSVWATAGLDVSSLPDGAVTVTAAQTVNGQTGSGSLVTSKAAAGIAPVVTISSAPAITAANELSYTVSGTCTANGTDVDVLVGSVAASAQCSGGIWSTAGLNVSGLANGPISVVASQTVGGLSGSGSLVISKDSEGLAPVVSITSAPVITAANETGYTVSGTCSENGLGLTVHIGDIAVVPQPVCSGGIWSTAAIDVSSLPDEAVLVTASQTVGTQTGTGSLVTTKDTAGAAPVVAITSAAAITAANQSAYTVSGTCTIEGSNVAVLVGSVTASASCTGGVWSTAALDVSGLPNGSVTVTASQTADGQTGSGSFVTSKDSAGTAPSVTLTTAPAITAANQAAYVVSGSCSVNGTDVSVLVGQVAATAPCNNGTWTTPGMDVSGLPAGAVTVMASQTAAGQTGSASVVVNKEQGGIVPLVNITPPPDITATNQTAYTVSGTCSVAGTNVAVQVGSIAASVACDGSTWTTGPLDVSSLPNGSVTVTASQTVSGGSGSASVVVNKTAVATAPVVTIESAPVITLANQASYTVSGTCSANGTNVAVQVGNVTASAMCSGGSWSAPSLNVSGLPEGVVVVTAEQVVGGEPGSDRVETTKTTTVIVPVVVITSAPAITASNEATYAVSGTCSANGQTVSVLVGTLPAAALCSDGIWATEPIDVSGLDDGPITVQASQDVGGQVGTVSLVISKDTAGAAPAVSVTLAPAITAANQAAYTVSGTCSVDGTNVAVQIGSVAASAQCNAGIWSSTAVDVTALADGPVTVTASQTQGALTGSGSLVTTKDAVGVTPVVSVTSAPAITAANQAAYTVSGTCSVNGTNVAVLVGSVTASAQCNAGIWTSGAVDVTGLPDGAVTVISSQTANGQSGSGSLVTAKDAAGVAPVVAITSAPAITALNESAYSVSGTCSANAGVVTVLVGSVSTSAQCNLGIWTTPAIDVSALADGSVTVTASQLLDELTGSASLVIGKDTAGAAPVVTVSSAPTITSTNQASYDVSGTCSANGSPVAVQVGSVAATASCAGGNWAATGLNVTALANGPVTVTAAQTDGGQTGSGSLLTLKDTAGVVPVVTVDSAPAITATNQAAYTVSGSCSVSGTTVAVQIGSVPASAPCTAGTWTAEGVNVSSLADGSVTVTAAQTAGGVIGSGSLVTSKTTGAVEPEVTITSAPAITAANQAAYVVAGTCSVNGTNVNVEVGSVPASVSASVACTSNSWTIAALDVSTVPDGTVIVTAAQTAGGLTGSDSVDVNKATGGVQPEVSISSAPAITAANQAAYTVSGTCSVNGTNVDVEVGSVPTSVSASVPCTSNSWTTAALNVSTVPDGTVTVTATQTVGGQSGSDSMDVNKTTGAVQPVVTITSAPAITATNASAYSVSGTCSANGSNVVVEVGSVSATALCNAGIWATEGMDVSGLADGSVEVTATQTVGGQTVTFTTSKDVAGAAPAVAITSAPAITAANQAAYTVSGTCSAEGANVDVRIGGLAASAVCNTGIWASSAIDVSGLADGPVSVSVSQTVGGQTGTGGFVTSKDAAGVVPVVAISSAPAITALNQGAYTVSGTCSAEGSTVTVLIGSIPASVQCNGGIWATSGVDVSGLADGAITVMASQSAGGQTGSGSLVTSKDSAGAAPSVAITSAPAITASNQTAYTVSGTCSADGANVAVLIGSLSASAVCNGGIWATSPIDVTGLPDGSVSVTVSQTAGGQTGTGSVVTTKDSAGAAPSVAITSAPAITAANQTAYSVSGTCSVNGSNVVVLIGSLSVSAPCNDGTWATAPVDVSGLPNGPITVTVSQTAGGQTGTGGFVTSKDSVGVVPVVTVTSAPAITLANQASYAVSGNCSANGSNVAVLVGSIPASATCNAGAWSVSGLNVSGLPNGPVTVTAAQTVGGQTGSGSLGTSKQAAAVAVTVNVAPSITSSNQASYGVVSGNCSAAAGTVTVSIGSTSNTVACNAGSWSLSGVDVRSLPEGPVEVRASQTVAGTVVSGTLNTVKDTAAPVVTITTAANIGNANQNAYSSAGTCTSGDGLVTVRVGSVTATVACVNGAWTAPGMRVGALPNGSVTVTASQTDEAGNTGSDTRQVSKNTDSGGEPPEPPVASIAAQNGTWIISDELNGEPGRGMGIEIQDGVLFMQIYSYRESGEPTFFTALGTLQDNTVTAPLYFYEGGRFFGSEQRDGHAAGSPGNVVITFTSRTTGTIQFPGEPAKAMQRFDYEGTPTGVFSDPAFVDRWAMVELNSNNQPVRNWWADIGSSEQVSLSEDWAAAAMSWPYPPGVATTVHGFGGTVSGHVLAQCSYGGRDRVFNCSGNRAGATGGPVIAMTMQRHVDQINGTLQEGGGAVRRLVGFRVARAAYTWQDNQSVRTSYYAPGYAPESGTWVVSNELRGLPGRGLSIELQKPINSEDHMLFMSVYDYQSDGKATFHSVLGAHDASTTPEPNTPDLPTVQYQGGRYFGGPAAIASFKDDAGLTQSIHFSAPSVGTLAFPGEQPVQIERFYYGVNKGSVQSLLGSWAVLSATDAMPSRNFRFQKRDENAVIDTDSGYVCVAEVLRQFNFRCSAPNGAPDFRFVAGFYGASTGIVGDAEDAPAITVMRVTDPKGERVQTGD